MDSPSRSKSTAARSRPTRPTSTKSTTERPGAVPRNRSGTPSTTFGTLTRSECGGMLMEPVGAIVAGLAAKRFGERAAAAVGDAGWAALEHIVEYLRTFFRVHGDDDAATALDR